MKQFPPPTWFTIVVCGFVFVFMCLFEFTVGLLWDVP